MAMEVGFKYEVRDISIMLWNCSLAVASPSTMPISHPPVVVVEPSALVFGCAKEAQELKRWYGFGYQFILTPFLSDQHTGSRKSKEVITDEMYAGKLARVVLARLSLVTMASLAASLSAAAMAWRSSSSTAARTLSRNLSSSSGRKWPA
ncbi:hypothetical protein RJ640_028201 [Escallonia rubra]|uniref:Uncharacterized protein n=1 Tax=Escallonia rubra TaxID=112253 RepID=A0AA88QFM7_9ASTE|nr:hypothetical protein RJ640_028201 [Escallonia rubra]